MHVFRHPGTEEHVLFCTGFLFLNCEPDVKNVPETTRSQITAEHSSNTEPVKVQPKAFHSNDSPKAAHGFWAWPCVQAGVLWSDPAFISVSCLFLLGAVPKSRRAPLRESQEIVDFAFTICARLWHTRTHLPTHLHLHTIQNLHTGTSKVRLLLQQHPRPHALKTWTTGSAQELQPLRIAEQNTYETSSAMDTTKHLILTNVYIVKSCQLLCL